MFGTIKNMYKKLLFFLKNDIIKNKKKVAGNNFLNKIEELFTILNTIKIFKKTHKFFKITTLVKTLLENFFINYILK